VSVTATPDALERQLAHFAAAYPAPVSGDQLADVDRIAFNVRLVTDRVGTDARIADAGGGIGMFSLACASLGMEAMLIDDFRDDGLNWSASDPALDPHRRLGVTIESRDIVTDGLGLEEGAWDAVTAFEVVEHLHHDVRRVVHAMHDALRPGGVLVIGVPNAVNVRKRLVVPLGRSNWPPFTDWYGPRVYHAHVHEPTVSELRLIAEDLRLADVDILGRNWLGLSSPSRVRRGITRAIDLALRRFPALCSSIYLVGRRQ
jgi:SAM-dependent methyltransferase